MVDGGRDAAGRNGEAETLEGGAMENCHLFRPIRIENVTGSGRGGRSPPPPAPRDVLDPDWAKEVAVLHRPGDSGRDFAGCKQESERKSGQISSSQGACLPLEDGGLRSGGHASPLTMFQISEYHDDDAFPTAEKEPHDPKLTWWGPPGGAKVPGSPASSENPELRRRIGSDPPLTDPETPDEVGTFRARSRSAPPILWAAQRYGRELRRMSDEFHGALQKLPRPKSAGTASQMHRTSGWKETLQSWWRRSSVGNCPPQSPS